MGSDSLSASSPWDWYVFLADGDPRDPPLFRQSEWSPLYIARNVYERKLSVSGGHLDEHLIAMALIYLLMPLALLALYHPGPPKALIAIAP
jgi:hypothetical protein